MDFYTFDGFICADPYCKFLVNGQRACIETCWLPALDSSSIDAFIAAMQTAVSPGCAIFTHEFKGAATRVPEQATAFGLRRGHVLIEILATWADRSDALEEQRHQRWARNTFAAFAAMALPGGYPNMLAGGDADRETGSYGGNAGRLIEAKRRYDPDNIFFSAIPLPVTQAVGVVIPASSNAGTQAPRVGGDDVIVPNVVRTR